MENKKTTENELIARFRGMQVNNGWVNLYEHPTSPQMSSENLDYNHNWSSLMPVVEQIEELGFSFQIRKEDIIIRPTSYFGSFPLMISIVKESKIDAVHDVVVQFIKWHNKSN